MSKPRRRTRVVVLDGEVYLLNWRRRDVVLFRRLKGWEREFALRHLDDAHADIEAHILGGKAS